MIPFCPVSRGLEEDAGVIQKAVDRVLRSGRLILGPEVEAFEREWADWVGAKHCVGVASGTAALELSLRSVTEEEAARRGGPPSVLVPANSAPATTVAVVNAGCAPDYCDIDARGLARFEQFSSMRAFVLLPVALYGNVPDLVRIQATPQGWHLPVVWDLAQAHGRGLWTGISKWMNARCGCYSFYPTKPLGAVGDAGAVVTDDENFACSLREKRNYGFGARDVVRASGTNARMDEIQAAILRERLRRLPARVTAQARVAEAYAQEAKRAGWNSRLIAGSHIVAVLVPDRQGVRTRLSERGIETGIHYPVASHLQIRPSLRGSARPLPATERWCAETLSLPCSAWTTEEEAKTVAKTLSEVLEGVPSRMVLGI